MQPMSHLPHQKPPSLREFTFGKVRANDIAATLRVIFDVVSVRLTCEEGLNFSIEDSKAFLRPIDSPEGVCHLLHKLHYPL